MSLFKRIRVNLHGITTPININDMDAITNAADGFKVIAYRSFIFVGVVTM